MYNNSNHLTVAARGMGSAARWFSVFCAGDFSFFSDGFCDFGFGSSAMKTVMGILPFMLRDLLP
jgi:hypothetical protein